MYISYFKLCCFVLNPAVKCLLAGCVESLRLEHLNSENCPHLCEEDEGWEGSEGGGCLNWLSSLNLVQ